MTSEFLNNFVTANHDSMIAFMSNPENLREWENMNLRIGSNQGVGYEAKVQLEEFVNKVQKKLNFNVESIEVVTSDCPINATFTVTVENGLKFDLDTALEVAFSNTNGRPIFRHVFRFTNVEMNGEAVSRPSEKKIKELAKA